MDIFGYHIPSLVGVGATFTSVYAAFARLDADQSEENRKFVKEWLLGIKVDDRYWAQFFKELFARVFGERHFSVKCIRRSALFSISICAVIFAIGYKWLGDGSPAVYLVLTVLWTVSAIIADYFSLWKTRILLTRSSLLSNGLTAMVIVVVDAFATLVFAIAAGGLIVLIAYLGGDRSSNIPELMLLMTKTAFSWPHIASDQTGIGRLMFLAPLFTSAWLWVYLLVAYAMRAASYLPSWLRPLSKFMDFESHPVRTIGYVAAAASALIVGIITLV